MKAEILSRLKNIYDALPNALIAMISTTDGDLTPEEWEKAGEKLGEVENKFIEFAEFMRDNSCKS